MKWRCRELEHHKKAGGGNGRCLYWHLPPHGTCFQPSSESRTCCLKWGWMFQLSGRETMGKFVYSEKRCNLATKYVPTKTTFALSCKCKLWICLTFCVEKSTTEMYTALLRLSYISVTHSFLFSFLKTAYSFISALWRVMMVIEGDPMRGRASRGHVKSRCWQTKHKWLIPQRRDPD